VKKERVTTKKRCQLVERYGADGKLIADVAKLIGVKVATAKGYAKRLGVQFPDYSPRAGAKP
jgi:hypothetical protein